MTSADEARLPWLACQGAQWDPARKVEPIQPRLHPITLFMLAHTDILNSHDYIHESNLRMEILLGMLASAKEEAPSFLAVILEGRQGKTACGDALQAISNNHWSLSRLQNLSLQPIRNSRWTMAYLHPMNDACSCRLPPKFQFCPAISQIGKSILALYTFS
jgi:hypothetical protein